MSVEPVEGICQWDECENEATVQHGVECLCRFHGVVTLCIELGPDLSGKALEEAHHCLQVKERPFNYGKTNEKREPCGS